MAGGPGGPGGPGNNAEEEKKDGTLTLTAEGELVVLDFDTSLNREVYQFLAGSFELYLIQLRGKSDLATRRAWPHELAGATQAYLKEKGEFPRGTIQRADSSERGIAWRPDQRLSWIASFLPYLGDEYRDWRPDLEKGWDEGRNQGISQRIIPHLVGFKQLK